ncbi:MAG: ABC transporter ATP-binding protein/permease, partial [bacterium]|nr:ABC transporter ATP-binding protein/permease [bacterium]
MSKHKKQRSITNLTIRLYAYHAFKYKRFVLPLIFSLTATILIMDYFQPYLQALVLDKVATGNFDSNNLWASFSSELIPYAIAVVLTGIIGWRINIFLIWSLEQHVLRDIAQRVFVHLTNLDANFHANKFGGSLVSQTNKLVGSYIRFADSMIFQMYTLIVSMLATVLILGPQVPEYAFGLITISIIYIIGTIFFSRPVREANTKQAVQESIQTGQLADSITNILAVKSFASEEYEAKRYWKEATKTKNLQHDSMVATTYRETFSSTMTSMIGIGALFVAVFGTRYFGADIALLFLIVTYTSTIGMRLWEFQNVLRQINRALGDASDMVKILQIVPTIKDPEEPEEVQINRGKIEIENMEFKYSDSNKPLFKNFNLRIKPGEKIGLVGRSGSGKTSLTSLLLRFSEVNEGSIKIDNQDIRNITQNDLRSHITYVPQEPLLFHRSLKENIAYSRPDASMQEIKAIAKLAHAEEFIKDLPKGYDTLVGERGVKLSGGQRQRVAIARSMLKNAPILLLDEATSALDSESEVLIQDALWKLMEGKTAIVIAHRLSTIQKMDRIIVMDKGEIIEEGTHKELIKNGGKYSELWA